MHSLFIPALINGLKFYNIQCHAKDLNSMSRVDYLGMAPLLAFQNSSLVNCVSQPSTCY